MKGIKKIFKFNAAAAALMILTALPNSLFAASMDEGLIDDVTAMITNAKKSINAIYVLDTSDAMNTFTYSDYNQTCEDAKTSIARALALCKRAFQQCANTQSAMMCEQDLGCDQINANCTKLQTNQGSINQKCDEIKAALPEPSYREVASVNLGTKAAKYVGPWDPTKNDYKMDVCFYNWLSDTDSNVLDNTASDHFTNESGGRDGLNTDRRDWDCITDGKGNLAYDENKSVRMPTEGLGGLWLNWKYATSLDALKIAIADTHRFTFDPRVRGVNSCLKYRYYPYKYSSMYCNGDTSDAPNCGQDACDESQGNCGKVCFIMNDTSLEYNVEQLSKVRSAIKDEWTVEYVDGTFDFNFCQAAGTAAWFANTVDPQDKGFVAINTYTNDAGFKLASEDTCSICKEWNNDASQFMDTPCRHYEESAGVNDPEETDIFNKSFEIEYNCCKTYTCANPKCRDDDESCMYNTVNGESVLNETCTLGYYSIFDQDAGHCCDPLVCSENGSVQHGDTEDICKEGTVTSDPSQTLPEDDGTDTSVAVLPPAAANTSYSNVALDIYMDLTNVNRYVDNVVVKVYSGCNTTDAAMTLFGEGTYTNTCSSDTCPDVLQHIIVSGSLSGCDSSGYKVRAAVTVNHKKDFFEKAEATVRLYFQLKKENYQVIESSDINILDPSRFFYVDYETSLAPATDADYVKEYECKLTFYSRSTVNSSSSCGRAPTTAQMNSMGVKSCSTAQGSLESEVIGYDNWGRPTTWSCSWLCRQEVEYDEAWKCLGFFKQMDDPGRNGTGYLNNCMGGAPCNIPAGEHPTRANLEACCKCVDQDVQYNQYINLESPTPVTFSEGGTRYNCAMSSFQNVKSEQLGYVKAMGYQAEIVEGHIKEYKDGSLRLSPYSQASNCAETGQECWYSAGVSFTPYNHWYKDFSLLENDALLQESFVSAFHTANEATRKIVCTYDLLNGYYGEFCGTGGCSYGCGSSGCGALNLQSESDDGCSYPSFWMKVPDSEGGNLFYGPKKLAGAEKVAFQEAVRDLKAIGGSALGETLYDVWRFLGGNKALYDSQYKNVPYTSPFEANEAQCFHNNVVVISGGQSQFDLNSALITKSGQGGDSIVSNGKPMALSKAEDMVSHSAAGYNPLETTKAWYTTVLPGVADFVKTKDFWHSEQSCRDADGNWLGFSQACANSDASGKNVIDKIISVGIGNWILSQFYHSNSTETDFLDETVVDSIATGGESYRLVATDEDHSNTFTTLMGLLTSMTTKGSAGDVVSGRPSWTSSLVQPLDVEEKVRGPEAYAAGAVPVDGSISRFWFGNLKKYMVDEGDPTCSAVLTDDANGDCGAWKKQTFPILDCFGSSDNATSGFSGSSMEDFQKLMAGGAAYKLKQRIEAVNVPGCKAANTPCYAQTTARNILYDLGTPGDLLKLHDASDASSEIVTRMAASVSGATAQDAINVLDYMYGFDAFSQTDRSVPRYKNTTTYEVSDPINVSLDPSRQEKVNIRPLYLGAIVHSQPLALYYQKNLPELTNATRIFAGANDGMLHSFDGDGNETFAYIPSNVFPQIMKFKDVSGETISFNATVDGPLTLLHIDKNHDGVLSTIDGVAEKALLIIGYRRGGRGYTVIDISDMDAPKFVQNINTTPDTGGYSFGKAIVFRKCLEATGCSKADQLEYYLAVPGGYDPCYDPSSGQGLNLASSYNDPRSRCVGNTFRGNKFEIYHYRKDLGKFDDDPVFSFVKGSADASIWAQSAFATAPFAVNTTNKLSIDTEYLYFTDISSTIFRVNVSAADPANWTTQVVYSKRSNSSPADINWTSRGIRAYSSVNMFPPQHRSYSYKYNDTDNEEMMILPVVSVTGNAANPKYEELDTLEVFYDKTTGDTSTGNLVKSSYTLSDQTNPTIQDTTSIFPLRSGDDYYDGWKVEFNRQVNDKNEVQLSEKGITAPLITYDFYGSKKGRAKNSYTVAWNTYIPHEARSCTNLGSSVNYERMFVTGENAFTDASGNEIEGMASWTSESCTQESNQGDLSLATSVGVIATKEGYDLTFGAGADIYRKKEIQVVYRPANIIKWYELY